MTSWDESCGSVGLSSVLRVRLPGDPLYGYLELGTLTEQQPEVDLGACPSWNSVPNAALAAS
jgi:hypothetical protein